MTKLFIGKLTGSVKGAGFLHGLGRQLSSALSFTSGIATFGFRVAHVFQVRTKSQMLRVDAVGDIASMENLKAVRYSTIANLVRQAMRRMLAAMESDQSTVTFIVQVASPKPAGLGFINVSPEKRGKWYGLSSQFVHSLSVNNAVRLARCFYIGRAVTILAEVA